jgi:phenylalanine-4-hydroxylase
VPPASNPLKVIDFRGDKIPNFDEVNATLMSLTGWSLEVVPNIVPKKEFFELLAEKKFPATSWLRTLKQLDYLEEPDMFHDVFAHVPLLTNPQYCDFFKELSQIALKHLNDEFAIELLGRVYWFTIEFGLIREADKVKIFGAGILSSNGESTYSVSPQPQHYNFDVDALIDSPYRTDIMQEKYFIIQSFDELYNALPEIAVLIDQRVFRNKKVA